MLTQGQHPTHSPLSPCFSSCTSLWVSSVLPQGPKASAPEAANLFAVQQAALQVGLCILAAEIDQVPKVEPATRQHLAPVFDGHLPRSSCQCSLTAMRGRWTQKT